MTVGVVMLVHTALHRAEQVVRHWATQDCPVVIHVDSRVSNDQYQPFIDRLSDLDNVLFSKRYRCEWGMWSLVAASQDASELMLERFPEASHIYLSSGACLPLRPLDDLKQYLAARPTTNFIESVTVEDVPWTVGGLNTERFTLRFPFSWRKKRHLFDWYVKFQRRWKMTRKIPLGLVPHLGSQWWCLTRKTLADILKDPNRKIYDRFFEKSWIPDESYFQTLARVHSDMIESRSLTLSKFDFQGKPHIFYDDHLQLLRRSDCFVARKIWPDAERLYSAFLNVDANPMKHAEPNPGKIDRIFSKALERRTRGRHGLYMQSRLPDQDHIKTAAPYSVLSGFSDLFEDFEGWLSRSTGSRVHGHLYAPDEVQFAGRQPIFTGALSANVKLRDYNACSFLTSLIWNARGEYQCFMHGPRDNQAINWLIATDPNAQISVISGAWAVKLFHENKNFQEARREAARLQRIEVEQLNILRSRHVKARVNIWSVADFVEHHSDILENIINGIGRPHLRNLSERPRMRDLTGFGQFLQDLKNQGMKPHLMGEFSVHDTLNAEEAPPKRQYMVK